MLVVKACVSSRGLPAQRSRCPSLPDSSCSGPSCSSVGRSSTWGASCSKRNREHESRSELHRRGGRPGRPAAGYYETTKGDDGVVCYARTKNSDRAFSSHPLLKEPMEVSMPQRGEIMVERLTGNRAMVIGVLSPEEVTCRFGDGRLEDRFTFELEPLLSLRDPRGGGRFVPLGSLVWLFFSGFVSRWLRQAAPASVTDRLRLVQPSDSSRSSLAV